MSIIWFSKRSLARAQKAKKHVISMGKSKTTLFPIFNGALTPRTPRIKFCMVPTPAANEMGKRNSVSPMRISSEAAMSPATYWLTVTVFPKRLFVVFGKGFVMPQGSPLIKWLGGKRELLPDLLRYVPRHIKTYYEPFMGGAALFWHLASNDRFTVAYLSDINPELVNLYRVVRDHPHEFMTRLAHTATCYKTAPDPEAFYKAKRSSKAPGDSIWKAADFVFLNKTSFNGLMRYNKKGEFNAPWGKEVDVTFYDPENISACSTLLRGVGIRELPYTWFAPYANEGDFVYFDPPYIPASKSANFASYTAEGFGPEDQKNLAKLFRSLSDKGVSVMLSNSDVPEIRELYEGFEIKIIQARRAVNSKGDGRGPVNEVLVLGAGMRETQAPIDLLYELPQEGV